MMKRLTWLDLLEAIVPLELDTHVFTPLSKLVFLNRLHLLRVIDEEDRLDSVFNPGEC